MIANVLLILFYVFFPMVILYLCRTFPMVNKVGSVVIAYIFGLILGNLGILPENSDTIQSYLTMISIPLAIPLLLFSANVKAWFRMAGSTMKSMIAALIAVIIVVFSGYLIFRSGDLENTWKISGMLVGVYTGGTPNLASLKMMLDVSPDLYIVTHTYDMILSSIYLLFLITLGKTVFSVFLKPFPMKSAETGITMSQLDGRDPYKGIFKKRTLISLSKAFGWSILIFAFAGAVSLLFSDKNQAVVVILLITTLGIGFSLNPTINRMEKTFELGMYFILIFSLVVASMADFSDFSAANNYLFAYITYVVFGTLIIHLILARLFKVDTDTLMVTSAAFICSPPFVPVIASAIRNKQVVISGLTVGILGYAIGNYLGYFIAQVLKLF